MSGRREPSFEVVDKILQYVGLPSALGENTEPLDPDCPSSASALDRQVAFFDQINGVNIEGSSEVVEIPQARVRISLEILRLAGLKAKAAACGRMRDRSMEKLIPEGAILGFDRSDTSIIDGEIYVAEGRYRRSRTAATMSDNRPPLPHPR